MRRCLVLVSVVVLLMAGVVGAGGAASVNGTTGGEATAVTSTTAAVAKAGDSGASTTYVIGGATVYEQFLPRADELLLTELTAAFDGDTVFPPVDWTRWTEVERTTHRDFDIVKYTRAGDGSE